MPVKFLDVSSHQLDEEVGVAPGLNRTNVKQSAPNRTTPHSEYHMLAYASGMQ